ncbi:MAG: LysR family transcriptional regulator [Bdellovibrionota bacterium]
MDNIHWQLSILSKAIHYKNLSGAAAHVGLSQPQLSRIISRLEDELGVVLLDRAARRKSGWTPVAFKIADTYFRTSRKLTQSLQQLKSDDQVTQISIGTLEGLVPLANDFCRQLLESKIHLIELNVFDLSELEERFEKDEMDLIFTCRSPGKHKYKNVRPLGYQVIQKQGDAGNLRVFSQFEYSSHVNSRKASSKDSRVLMSNSLAVRKYWIEDFGGGGFVPSDVRRQKKAETDVPVVMVASDMINPALWQRFESIRL